MKTKTGTQASDELNGTSGDDKIYGLAGDDTINGGSGDDVLDGGVGLDHIYGGGGDDRISCGDDGSQSDPDMPQSDEAYGGSGDDILKGGAGSQYLSGDGGDDRIFGGAGDDFLFGSNGKDTLDGGAGNDYLNGGSGKNTVSGGAGDDRLESLTGHDALNGGIGQDTYFLGGSTSPGNRIDVFDRKGSDVYWVNNNDAHITIEDHAGFDRLDLQYVTTDQLVFTHDLNDLVIEADGYRGETRIVDFFSGKSHRVETLIDSSADTFDLSDVVKHIRYGGESVDGGDVW